MFTVCADRHATHVKPKKKQGLLPCLEVKCAARRISKLAQIPIRTTFAIRARSSARNAEKANTFISNKEVASGLL